MTRKADQKGQRLKREADQRHQRETAKLTIEQSKVNQATAFRVAELRYGAIRLALLVIGAAVVAYFVAASVREIAGKTTDFHAVANGVFGLSINEWVGYSVAAVCGVGWYNSGRLRRAMEKEQEQHSGKSEVDVGSGEDAALPGGGLKRKKDRDA